MVFTVGFDVAKDFHWMSVMDPTGEERVSRRVGNDPGAIDDAINELLAFGDSRVGIDVVGGIASLLTVQLHEAGIEVVHISGLAVNRAREGTVGGENKSDPRDARVIADLVRTRRDLRVLEIADEANVELRLLVGHRRAMITDRTRQLARLHDLVMSIHPGLGQVLDLRSKTDLWLLTRYVTPVELRRAGRRRLVDHLAKLPRTRASRNTRLVDEVLEVSKAQRVQVPGEAMTGVLIRELAHNVLGLVERLATLEGEIAGRVDEHRDGEIVLSLPGMGTVLAAEFISLTGGIERYATGDQLAAAAGLAPALRQSGRSRNARRPKSGSKDLKRVLYQSAFCSLNHPASRAYYDRKRGEGKRHHQAVIALARRRANVLHTMLNTRQTFDPERAQAA